MNGSHTQEYVKYSISIEMEVPSYESTRHLPDSWIVRFEKGKEQIEGGIQKHSIQSSEDKVSNADIELDKKLKLFIDIFRALSGDDRNDVKKESLIDELINTGKYTEEEAIAYIKNAQQYGFIFERKMDMYTLA